MCSFYLRIQFMKFQETAITKLSGFVAGGVSSAALWPLNVIQVQSQVSGQLSALTSVRSIFRNILHTEGIVGFYRGVGKGISAYSIFYGSFFYTNDLLKYHFQNCNSNDIIATLLRGYISAAVGSVLSNPFHVVRIRAQSRILRPQNTPITLYHIYKMEGITVLNRGLNATLVKNWELGIIVCVHEYLSDHYLLPAYITSGIGKMIATTITYPIDSYRTARRFDSTFSHRKILRNFVKQPQNMYKGYWLYVARSIPATVIAFHIRENFSKLFRKYSH